MGNGSKQFHSKSRNCNFQGPVCSNCHRRNELCDYLRDYNFQPAEIEASPNQRHITLLESSHADHKTRTMILADEHSYLSTWGNLFGALDYYPTFANEPEILAYTTSILLNTDSAPFTLSQCDDYQKKRLGYLLPTVSSLCAIYRTLHRESQSPGTHAQALQYNITASTKFRHAEHRVHEGNWLPVLMFGVGHIMFNFAAAQSVPDCGFEYLDIFHILRGTSKMGNEIGVFLEKSELSGILERRRQEIAQPLGSDDSLQAMDQLSQADHPEGTFETTRTHCRHALGRLKWWSQLVHGVPRNWKHFILWPASVTDEFVTALAEKQPVALLVYIYWCAIMHRSPRRCALLEWPTLALNLQLVAMIYVLSKDVRVQVEF
ncbi:hypothetical protein EKO27_g2636 [Xylaria grammica]|uniref:Zn(2)-C6 fungal-type domain-containing protein n=1 Tax=Xylaria grammica TaxID=363999 RepID=A0A439DDG0_9PEZI|nr:hypothetical protein EKO27_g2636 [Xylaria grammica]